MPVASAIAGVGGSLISGFLGSSAAQNAANAQAASQNKAIAGNNTALGNSLAAQNNVFLQDQQNLQPYQAAGTAALSQLGGSVLQGAPNAQQVLAQDPGYQFRLDQGQLALQRAEAAGGGVGSGGAMKAAEQYGQDYASGEYGAAFNRFMQSNQQRYGQLMGLAGLGQNANQQFASAGANYANQSGALNLDTAQQNAAALTNIGNAQASGYVGSANAWSGALGGIQQSLPGLAGLFKSGGGSGGGGMNSGNFDQDYSQFG